MTAPASGTQFFLRAGRFRAQIGQVAAGLRSFSRESDGVVEHFTETWPDEWIAPMGCGIVLVPWPNRVAGAVWSLHGAKQQLDVTEPSRGNATHGLLRNTAYAPVAQTDAAVTLAAQIVPQHGYPFTLDVAVGYQLDEQGLRVTHTLTNRGAAAAPFGVGSHPYLRVGDTPAADLRVTVAAATRLIADDKLIPTGQAPVEGDTDLRSGRLVSTLGQMDCAFTDLDVADGRVEHRLTAPDGRSLTLWADEIYRYAQVFTPAVFPGPGLPGQRTAIAIEPMTCAADALNNGWGLQWLDPGATWSASWGLRPS